MTDPGLPHPQPTRSFWLIDNPLSNHRTTVSLPGCADIVILGAGITGASVAYHLTKLDTEGKTILCLDARAAAGGASGRCGGNMTNSTYRYFKYDMKKYGLDIAKKIRIFELETVLALKKLIKDHGWEKKVELREGGTVHSYLTDLEFNEAIENIEEMRNQGLGHELRIWDRLETVKKTHGEDFVGAVMNPNGSQLSPSKLTIQLLQLALKSGYFNLQTYTPVQSITPYTAESAPANIDISSLKGQPKWIINTNRGSVICSKVIHCTNGYCAHLLPQLRDCIVPVRGQMMITIPSSIPRLWPFGISINRGYIYGWQRNDNMVILGGARGEAGPELEYNCSDDSDINTAIDRKLRQFLPTHFGDMVKSPTKIMMTWAGIMGMSNDVLNLPWVGPIPGLRWEGQYISAGYHGHGMPRAFHCAKAVAQMVLGSKPDVPGWMDEMLPSKKTGPTMKDWARKEDLYKIMRIEDGLAEMERRKEEEDSDSFIEPEIKSKL